MRVFTKLRSCLFLAVAAGLFGMPTHGQQGVSPGAGQVPSVRKSKPDITRQVTPPVKEVAAEGQIPANLFELDDRAIIVVGGKQLRAGEIKRELNVELERLSGPPVTLQSVSRLGRQSLLPTKEELEGAFGRPRAKQAPVTGQPRSKELATRPSADAQARQGPTAMEAIEYCNKNPAKITRVTGVLTPGGNVSVDGECFGDKNGQVLAFGQFTGGTVKLAFERWSNHRIVALLPAVKGVADHQVQLTVVRADNTRTPGMQVDFRAARERVEVPGRYWSPGEKFDDTSVHRFDNDSRSFGSTHHSVYSKRFRLSIDKACALDDSAWTSSVGSITLVKGWEIGPPNQADVEVTWQPQCTRVERTSSGAFSVGHYEATSVCRIAFDVKAWAHCPVGVAP